MVYECCDKESEQANLLLLKMVVDTWNFFFLSLFLSGEKKLIKAITIIEFFEQKNCIQIFVKNYLHSRGIILNLFIEVWRSLNSKQLAIEIVSLAEFIISNVTQIFTNIHTYVYVFIRTLNWLFSNKQGERVSVAHTHSMMEISKIWVYNTWLKGFQNSLSLCSSALWKQSIK